MADATLSRGGAASGAGDIASATDDAIDASRLRGGAVVTRVVTADVTRLPPREAPPPAPSGVLSDDVRTSSDGLGAANSDTIVMPLSPFDVTVRGRTVPMAYHYAARLDPDRLTRALELVLGRSPVLAGRYNIDAALGHTVPLGVTLNNTGVPVEICDLASAKGPTLPAHLRLDGADAAAPRVFGRSDAARFYPAAALAEMDPDRGSSTAPLMAIKVTLGTSDTALGVAVQHGVCDAEAMFAFVRDWGLAYTKLGAAAAEDAVGADAELLPPPSHDRLAVLPRDAHGAIADAPRVAGDDLKRLTAGIRTEPFEEPSPPEFAAVMPRIVGEAAVIVPFSATQLKALKARHVAGSLESTAPVRGTATGAAAAAAAAAAAPTRAATHTPGPGVVSTDDLLTARVWRAQCRVRVKQLGLDAHDAGLTTTLMRAVNVRKRVRPALPDRYYGNAVVQVWTRLPVATVLAPATTPEADSDVMQGIAHALRASLQELASPDALADVATWERQQHTAHGRQTRYVFDKHALTFIVSSWRFSGDVAWSRAAFGAHAPVAFDHSALSPVASVFTSAAGGGINVWTSGTKAAMEEFAAAVSM